MHEAVRRSSCLGDGFYYFFSPALCFAHRAFCAAEILARASADMVRFFLPAVAADPRILLTTNAV